MNDDTLSFGTSIKCVQHIILANALLISVMTVGKVILHKNRLAVYKLPGFYLI